MDVLELNSEAEVIDIEVSHQNEIVEYLKASGFEILYKAGLNCFMKDLFGRIFNIIQK
jgi:hypothetical protein